MILTTHFLFDHEQHLIGELFAGIKVITHHYGEFLNDAALLACDKAAAEEMQKSLGVEKMLLGYDSYFKQKMNQIKNERIKEKLLNKYSFKKIFHYALGTFTVDLGISEKPWIKAGSKNFQSEKWLPSIKDTPILHDLDLSVYRLKTKLNQWKEGKITVYSIEEGKNIFLFFSIRRLSFSTPPNQKEFSLPKLPLIGQTRRIKSIIRSYKKEGHQLYIGVPLHTHNRYFLKSLGEKVLIFEDAFRPTNYPRYYYVDIFGPITLVPRDMFDSELFSRNGQTIFKPYPRFLKKNQMASPKKYVQKDVEVIILSLNCAGDWSAMVNRSDTDLLIAAFVELAHQYPTKTFIIRPHPTLPHKEHEGVNAIERIQAFIDFTELDNLSLSKTTLEVDWERGDLFISEYSLSVIDAIKYGKLGLFVNLTNRRSFFQDYADLGFYLVNNKKDLFGAVRQIINTPVKFVDEQIAAIDKYNQKLTKFYEELNIEVSEVV